MSGAPALKAEVVMVVESGAVLIRANGVRLYPKGGPDNNPIVTQAISTLEGLSSILLATAKVGDVEVRGRIESLVTRQIQEEVGRLAAV